MEVGITQVIALIGAVASILCTVVVGALAYFIKKTLDNLAKADERNAEEIERLKAALGDLKSDLPLIYTLREDFIRVMNTVDSKLDKLLGNSKTKEG